MTFAAGGRLGAWSLRRRLALLFAMVAVALIGSVAFTAAGVVHLNDTVHIQIDSIDPAQVAAVDFLNGMVNQQTGVRGYVIARDRLFLAPFIAGQSEELAAYGRLERLLKGQPLLGSDLDRLLNAAETWQRDSADQQIIATEAHSSSARSAGSTALGTRRFDQVRRDAGLLLSALAGRHAAADSAIASADTTLIVLLAVGLALIMLAVEGTLLVLGRWVTRPILDMAEEARIVSAGDLTHPIAVAGPPEIRLLAADVDSMRRRILNDLHLVEEARRLLGEQAERLRRSNADLEQFAYVASHDLQEPLRKISSFSELVSRRYEDKLDARGREYLGFVADGARRMQVLINDVLELSRVGRSGVALGAVDCSDAARSALSNLAEEVGRTGADVIVRRLPVVLGDRSLLIALFQNLIGNSLKFRSAEPPQIVIEAHLAGPELTSPSDSPGADGGLVANRPEDRFWHFSVHDNGIGIEPEYRERIFAMFQRLHSREQYGGTGIGLALCRRIVEYHGGRIWVDPEVGLGTTVCWTIPQSSLAEAGGT